MGAAPIPGGASPSFGGGGRAAARAARCSSCVGAIGSSPGKTQRFKALSKCAAICLCPLRVQRWGRRRGQRGAGSDQGSDEETQAADRSGRSPPRKGLARVFGWRHAQRVLGYGRGYGRGTAGHGRHGLQNVHWRVLSAGVSSASLEEVFVTVFHRLARHTRCAADLNVACPSARGGRGGGARR